MTEAELYAIRERYDVANAMAITHSDRLTFASLQDILILIKEVKRLQENENAREIESLSRNCENRCSLHIDPPINHWSFIVEDEK